MADLVKLIQALVAAPVRGIVVMLLVSVTACATGSRAHGDVSGEAAGSTAPMAVIPSGPPAQVYRSFVPAAPATDSFVLQIKAELDRFMKARGRPALAEDARLNYVATDLARISAGKQVSSVAQGLGAQ